MALRKNITRLSWFNFFFNFRLYGAIAILYLADITHSYALGASVFSIAQLAQALFEVPTGIYSDKLGRRLCLILGAVASLASVVCYASASGYILLVVGAGLRPRQRRAKRPAPATILGPPASNDASINSLLGSLLFAAFALVLGVVADHWGPTAALLVAQGCLLPIVFLYMKVRRDVHRSITIV